MTVYIFPGQGSQAKGMGESLFSEFPALVKSANDVLGYSINDICLNNPDNRLHKTQYTQPALFVVNALSYIRKTGDRVPGPDYLMGHSLGEYNALHAAGALDFEDGLQLVKKRGELMAKAPKGAMAAVLNAEEDSIKQLLSANELSDVDIANYNSPSQFVLSGPESDIEKLIEVLGERKINVIRLNTSGAFHSRQMESVQTDFADYLNSIRISDLSIPVISNVYAKPYCLNEVQSTLAKQITCSVRWSDSVKYLLDKGETVFEELGVGRVLTGLVEDIKKNQEKFEIDQLLGETKKSDTESISRNKTNLSEDEHSKRQKSLDPRQIVARWNAQNSTGTEVVVKGYDQPQKTRTTARVIFGHRAAIYLEGFEGYFSLGDVKPLQ